MSDPVTSALPRVRLNPGTLAWIGQGRPPPQGVADAITTFADSDDFLLSSDPYAFDFYVVHLEQRGVRGVDLLRLVRRRSAAGMLALGNLKPGELALALDSGADMVLPLPVSADDLSAGVGAVHRRALQERLSREPSRPWTLKESRAALQAPDGTEIGLSQSELVLMRCFAESAGAKVERQVLVERLWGAQAGSMENALHATVYRLRKRIEQAGHAVAPLHAVARVGYEFRAPLVGG